MLTFREYMITEGEHLPKDFFSTGRGSEAAAIKRDPNGTKIGYHAAMADRHQMYMKRYMGRDDKKYTFHKLEHENHIGLMNKAKEGEKMDAANLGTYSGKLKEATYAGGKYEATNPDFEVTINYGDTWKSHGSFHSESAAKREGNEAAHGKQYKVTNNKTGKTTMFKNGKEIANEE